MKPVKKEILIYGDSLTFGKIPGGLRFSKDLRFTGVMQKNLGEKFLIIEEGLRGRTVSGENAFFPYRDGLEQFGPIFGSHLPLDVLVLFLGTNDINSGSKKTVEQIASVFPQYKAYMEWWCEHLGFKVPKIMLVSPPLVHEENSIKAFGKIFVGAQEKSLLFSQEYKLVAEELHWEFFDASKVVEPSKIDGVHLDEEKNKLLGEALAQFVLKHYENSDNG